MQKLELTSKFMLAALIATVVFSAITIPSVVAQSSTAPPVRANSVTSGSIKDGEVKTPDLADGAVTSQKIAPRTLNLKMHFVDENIIVEVGQARGIQVSCPSGEQVTGGGYHSDPDMSTYINSPSEGASGIPTGWQVAAQNNGNQDHELVAFVMCAQPFPFP